MPYKVALNAGHGEKNSGVIDTGAIGATGYREYIQTKELTVLVDAKLRFNGVTTLFIQDGDLWDVTNLADNWKADYFVSVHCNSVANPTAHGVETFSLATTGNGRTLAQAIHKELVPATGLYDRGLKTANYHVLRETDMPACLTEVGFISNPKEEALMKDSNWDNKVSSAIAKGICNFLGIIYKEQPSPPSPTPSPSKEIYRVKVNSIQVGAFENKDSAISTAQIEYDKSPVGTRVIIKQKSDGKIIFDQTKPSPTPITPSPTGKILYRIILDKKQVSAVSSIDSAKNEVIKAVDNGLATKGVIQRNTDSVDVFTYTKTIITPSIPKTPILGTETISVEQCNQFIKKVNPNALNITHIYKKYGELLGIKWGYAVAQMIKETSYLRYGGSVLLSQNNYAGIGAIGNGAKGAYFNTPDEGVLAHLEHLFAYASKQPLPSNLLKIDPRYDLVTRGIAPNFEDLNGRWAVPGNNYGEEIVDIYELIKKDVIVEPIPKIKNLVTYVYSDDLHSSFYLASYLQCDYISYDKLIQEMINDCENIFQVGGKLVNKRFKLISGNDMYDTLVEVMKEIGMV